MTTFNEFINERNVSMDAKYVGPSEDDRQFDWIVTIKHNKKSMRVDYHMGLAHCTKKIHFYDQDLYKKNQHRISTISQLEKYGIVTPNKPALADVLQSIQLDASVSDYYQDKWDFIDALGYDGREGERVYNLCIEQNRKAKAFFADLYGEFMELEEE